jgi:hypothetical protein
MTDDEAAVEFIQQRLIVATDAAIAKLGDDDDIDLTAAAIVALARFAGIRCADVGKERGLAFKIFLREFTAAFERDDDR